MCRHLNLKISVNFLRIPECCRKCPKMFRQLLSTSKAISELTILEHFDFVRTQNHHSASLRLNFIVNHVLIKNNIVWICESGVRNCP